MANRTIIDECLTEVNHRSLGSIVRGLQLRDIDNVAAHGRGSDEATVRVVDQFLAIEIRPLLLLSSPMLTRSMSAVVCAIHVGGHDLLVMLDVGVKKIALRPWDTSVSDEDIKTAVEFLHDFVNGLLDELSVCHIDLVRLAYG